VARMRKSCFVWFCLLLIAFKEKVVAPANGKRTRPVFSQKKSPVLAQVGPVFFTGKRWVTPRKRVQSRRRGGRGIFPWNEERPSPSRLEGGPEPSFWREKSVSCNISEKSEKKKGGENWP